MKQRIKQILNKHDYVSDFFENKKNIDIAEKFKNIKNREATTILKNFLHNEKIKEDEFSKHFYDGEPQISVISSHLFIEILRNPNLSFVEANTIFLHFLSDTIERELKNLKTEDKNILNILSEIKQRQGG
ncbi:hypothetical protein ACRZ5S_19720 [Vibrio scophthalmi]|uniref:hypothetical protein n=1 Tax=Vibrio scophthalmi TaxID=45658 RepID=UPI003EBED976